MSALTGKRSTSSPTRHLAYLSKHIMSKEPVAKSELHSPANSPSELQSTLKTPDGQSLTDRQAQHLAIVLDLFRAKGTMAKIKDNFTEDAVYEDLFATCKNRDEVGECPP
jgi:hypothetical protein